MIIGTAREQETGAWSKPWNKSGMKSGGKGAATESLVTQLRKSQLIRIPREGQQDRRGGGRLRWLRIPDRKEGTRLSRAVDL